MRTLLLITVATLAIACSKKDATSGSDTKVPEVTIEQLDAMLAKKECVAVDANGDGTRKKMGVVPGAILLTDSDTFKDSELGTDKTKGLVFYCASTTCGASHKAAEKALTAGYTNVKVLPEGIAGWVKANKTVQKI